MTKVVRGILIAAVAVVVLLGIAIGVVVGVGLYQWKNVVRRGNEAAAVQHLNTISIGQVQYYTENATYATFDQLVEKGYLDSRFAGATPTVDGYIYVLRVTTASAGQKASFTLNADPENAAAGTKHFFIDSSNSTVRVNRDRPANPNDPASVK